MNTVSKGNAFEDTVFEIIKRELENNRLGFSPAQAKIFKKKGYFSKDRGSEIFVDIAIEVWPSNAKNYSLLWICECKDYSGTVPVNDIEEFKAKLDQIGGKNIKGVFASPNALQRGAFTYAQSNGIGIVRILADDQVDWLMHFMTIPDGAERINSREFNNALLDQNLRGKNRSFYAVCDGYFFGDWYSLLSSSLNERSIQQ